MCCDTRLQQTDMTQQSSLTICLLERATVWFQAKLSCTARLTLQLHHSCKLSASKNESKLPSLEHWYLFLEHPFTTSLPHELKGEAAVISRGKRTESCSSIGWHIPSLLSIWVPAKNDQILSAASRKQPYAALQKSDTDKSFHLRPPVQLLYVTRPTVSHINESTATFNCDTALEWVCNTKCLKVFLSGLTIAVWDCHQPFLDMSNWNLDAEDRELQDSPESPADSVLVSLLAR